MSLDPNDIPHNAYSPCGRLVFSARSIPYGGTEERGPKVHYRVPYSRDIRKEPGTLPSAAEGLEQCKLPCASYGMGSVLSSQFEEEAADVFLDGGERNHQAFGDLMIGCTVGKEAQYFLLAPGERLQQWFRRESKRVWMSWSDPGSACLQRDLMVFTGKSMKDSVSIGCKAGSSDLLL